MCGRFCNCIHTCVADTAVCMPPWQIVQLHACMCGWLCNCMHAFVAHTTSKVECGRLCDRVCGRLCCCMSASVADNAVLACLCGKLCTYMHASVAKTACAAEYACIPLWQIMQIRSCLCGRYYTLFVPMPRISALYPVAYINLPYTKQTGQKTSLNVHEWVVLQQ